MLFLKRFWCLLLFSCEELIFSSPVFYSWKEYSIARYNSFVCYTPNLRYYTNCFFEICVDLYIFWILIHPILSSLWLYFWKKHMRCYSTHILHNWSKTYALIVLNKGNASYLNFILLIRFVYNLFLYFYIKTLTVSCIIIIVLNFFWWLHARYTGVLDNLTFYIFEIESLQKSAQKSSFRKSVILFFINLYEN